MANEKAGAQPAPAANPSASNAAPATPAPADGPKFTLRESGYVDRPTDPLLFLEYGKPGLGKTFVMLRGAANFLWIAAPGGLKPLREALGGYRPVEINTMDWGIEELISILPQAATMKNKNTGAPFEGVGIDDWSHMADISYKRAEVEYERRCNSGEMTRNKFAFWDIVKEPHLRFRQTARSCGMNVFANAHVRFPSTDDKGVFHPGGPLLPMKQLSETVPQVFDLVLRGGIDAGAPKIGEERSNTIDFWPGVFLCDPRDSQWITKDRDGFALPKGPMNLGVLARCAGYKLGYPPGLEFFWELTYKVGDAIIAGGTTTNEKDLRQSVANETVKRLTGKPAFDRPRIECCVEWILTDIRDYVAIMRPRANRLGKFGVALGA